MTKFFLKKKYLLVAILFTTATTAYAQTKDELMAKRILESQITAWNAGDLQKFMQGYWKNDSLQFIGKSGVTRGWQQTLDNYKKNYPDTAAMGKLTFNLLEVKQLSATYIFVVGKWQLTRSIGNLSGHYTLLFKKIKGEWLIVADHSS